MRIATFEWADGWIDATNGQKIDPQDMASGTGPSFASVHFDADTPRATMSAAASALAQRVHGATSCKGSVTNGSTGLGARATAFCIWDEDGDYGTAMAGFHGSTPRAAGAAATADALDQADRDGEKPDMVIVSATPGDEEAVLAGIMDVVGADVPIFGGTAADNTVSGGWLVTDGTEFAAQGVTVSVLFPSTRLHFAYHNGYAPSAHAGTVTKAEGRKLIEIDGQPAAQKYHDWTNGQVLPRALGSEHNILAEATMAPLGQFLDEQDGVANYLLVHPAQLHADGSLGLFAEVTEGEVLTQMVGDTQALSERAGRVAAQAVSVGGVGPDDIAGAFMIYCGGCLLAVEDRVGTILDGVKQALPGTPFQTAFTFGEQGQVRSAKNRPGENWSGENRHGNLMISCVVFTNMPQ